MGNRISSREHEFTLQLLMGFAILNQSGSKIGFHDRF
jgi:hypothetical protein